MSCSLASWEDLLALEDTFRCLDHWHVVQLRACCFSIKTSIGRDEGFQEMLQSIPTRLAEPLHEALILFLRLREKAARASEADRSVEQTHLQAAQKIRRSVHKIFQVLRVEESTLQARIPESERTGNAFVQILNDAPKRCATNTMDTLLAFQSAAWYVLLSVRRLEARYEANGDCSSSESVLYCKEAQADWGRWSDSSSMTDPKGSDDEFVKDMQEPKDGPPCTICAFPQRRCSASACSASSTAGASRAGPSTIRPVAPEEDADSENVVAARRHVDFSAQAHRRPSHELCDRQASDSTAVLKSLRFVTREAVPQLIKALKDPDDDVRRSAAEALGTMGPAAAEIPPHLIEALEDQTADVRHSAPEALGKMGPATAESVPQLVKALEDQNDDMRSSAAEVLNKMGPAAESVPQLIKVLEEDQDDDVCSSMECLDRRCQQPLLEGLVPNSVKPFAYNNCTASEHVETFGHLTSIRNGAFSLCSAWEITQISKPVSIGSSAFQKRISIRYVKMLESVANHTQADRAAFRFAAKRGLEKVVEALIFEAHPDQMEGQCPALLRLGGHCVAQQGVATILSWLDSRMRTKMEQVHAMLENAGLKNGMIFMDCKHKTAFTLAKPRHWYGALCDTTQSGPALPCSKVTSPAVLGRTASMS